MKWKHCFAKLPADNLDAIQEELTREISDITKGFTDWTALKSENEGGGWMYLKKEHNVSLTKKPIFSDWLKTNKIYPIQYSIIVVNEKINPVTPHKDQGPNAKINVPLLNNKDWYNRWFDENGNIIAETEIDTPIVFNSYVDHDVVYKGTNIKYPRIVLSITMINDTVWEEKYLIN